MGARAGSSPPSVAHWPTNSEHDRLLMHIDDGMDEIITLARQGRQHHPLPPRGRLRRKLASRFAITSRWLAVQRDGDANSCTASKHLEGLSESSVALSEPPWEHAGDHERGEAENGRLRFNHAVVRREGRHRVDVQLGCQRDQHMCACARTRRMDERWVLPQGDD